MSHQVNETSTSSEYEPPRIQVLGSVHALTLRNKAFGLSDGDMFNGQGLMTIS